MKEEESFENLLKELKSDILFDEHRELGNLLMKHIDDLTPKEIARYNELKEIITNYERNKS